MTSNIVNAIADSMYCLLPHQLTASQLQSVLKQIQHYNLAPKNNDNRRTALISQYEKGIEELLVTQWGSMAGSDIMLSALKEDFLNDKGLTALEEYYETTLKPRLKA